MSNMIRDSLVVGRVIGDVLDPFASSVSLNVTYGAKKVDNGCEFKPSQVVNQPRVDVGGNDAGALYTLVMVDPDSPNPSNPHLKEYLHWYTHTCIMRYMSLPANFQPYRKPFGHPNEEVRKFLCEKLVTDIPARSGASSGQEIVSYESPRPTVGIHRFVFVLFRQSESQTLYAPGWRQNFNTRDFAELYNLGLPVAAGFFNCQRESGCGGRRRN